MGQIIRAAIAAVLVVCAAYGQYTAVFPGTVATDAELGTVSYRASSLLAATISDSQTTLTVTTGQGALFGLNNFVIVENEKMRITGIAGDTLTVVRGFAGTTAVQHLINTPIVNATLPDYHNRMSAEMQAVQANVLKRTSNLGDLTNAPTARGNLGFGSLTIPVAATVLVQGSTAVSNQYLTAIDPTTGVISRAQPSASQITNTAGGSISATTVQAAINELRDEKQAFDADLDIWAQMALTDDTIPVANGTTWQNKAIPSCSDATNSKLLYNNTTNSFSCGADQSGSGGPPTYSVVTQTSSGTVSASATHVLCDATSGTVNITIPVTANRIVSVKKIDSSTNNCTITPASGTVDGSSNLSWFIRNQAFIVAGNGTNLYTF